MKHLITCLLCCLALAGWSQGSIAVHGGTQYLRAEALDNAVNGYNFNRPWTDNTLGHLSFGYNAGIDYANKVNSLYRLGIMGRWSHFAASTETADPFQVRLQLFEIMATADFYFLAKGAEKDHPFNDAFVRLAAGYGISWARTSNENDDSDADPGNYTGMSFPVLAYIGYDIQLGSSMSMTPMIGSGWYPRIGVDGISRQLAAGTNPDADFDQGSVFDFQLRLAWPLNKPESE